MATSPTHIHDQITPDGVWEPLTSVSLGKAHSLLCAARASVKRAMSRGVPGATSVPGWPDPHPAGPNDSSEPMASDSIGDITKPLISTNTYELPSAATLHGDATASDGMSFLLQRHTGNLAHNIAQQGDAGTLPRGELTDAWQGCARESAQSFRPAPPAEDAFHRERQTRPFGRQDQYDSQPRHELARQAGTFCLQHDGAADAPRREGHFAPRNPAAKLDAERATFFEPHARGHGADVRQYQPRHESARQGGAPCLQHEGAADASRREGHSAPQDLAAKLDAERAIFFERHTHDRVLGNYTSMEHQLEYYQCTQGQLAALCHRPVDVHRPVDALYVRAVCNRPDQRGSSRDEEPSLSCGTATSRGLSPLRQSHGEEPSPMCGMATEGGASHLRQSPHETSPLWCGMATDGASTRRQSPHETSSLRCGMATGGASPLRQSPHETSSLWCGMATGEGGKLAPSTPVVQSNNMVVQAPTLNTMGDVEKHLLEPLHRLCQMLPTLYDNLRSLLTPETLNELDKRQHVPVLHYIRRSLVSRGTEPLPNLRALRKRLRHMAVLYRNYLSLVPTTVDKKDIIHALSQSLGDLTKMMGTLGVEGFPVPAACNPPIQTKKVKEKERVTSAPSGGDLERKALVPNALGIQLVARATRYNQQHPNEVFRVPDEFLTKELYSEQLIKGDDWECHMEMNGALGRIIMASTRHVHEVANQQKAFIAGQRDVLTKLHDKIPTSGVKDTGLKTVNSGMRPERVPVPVRPTHRITASTLATLPAFTLFNVSLHVDTRWMPFDCSIADVMEHYHLGSDLTATLTNDRGRAAYDPSSINSDTVPFEYIRAYRGDPKRGFAGPVHWQVGYATLDDLTKVTIRLTKRLQGHKLFINIGELELRCDSPHLVTASANQSHPTFDGWGRMESGVDAWQTIRSGGQTRRNQEDFLTLNNLLRLDEEGKRSQAKRLKPSQPPSFPTLTKVELDIDAAWKIAYPQWAPPIVLGTKVTADKGAMHSTSGKTTLIPTTVSSTDMVVPPSSVTAATAFTEVDPPLSIVNISRMTAAARNLPGMLAFSTVPKAAPVKVPEQVSKLAPTPELKLVPMPVSEIVPTNGPLSPLISPSKRRLRNRSLSTSELPVVTAVRDDNVEDSGLHGIDTNLYTPPQNFVFQQRKKRVINSDEPSEAMDVIVTLCDEVVLPVADQDIEPKTSVLLVETDTMTIDDMPAPLSGIEAMTIDEVIVSFYVKPEESQASVPEPDSERPVIIDATTVVVTEGPPFEIATTERLKTIEADTGGSNSCAPDLIPDIPIPDVMFTLPFEASVNTTIIAVVIREEFAAIDTLNAPVSNNILDALIQFEKREFFKQIGQADPRLLIITLSGFMCAMARFKKPTTEGATKLIQAWGLTNLDKYDLVCVPLEGVGHFSFWFWLPALFKYVHLDSWSGSSHHILAKRMEHVANFAYVVHCDTQGIRYDEDKKVSQQLTKKKVIQQVEGSNACAFAAASFLRGALDQVVDLVTGVSCIIDDSNIMTRQQYLLDQLIVAPSSNVQYKKYRGQASNALESLAAEYRLYRQELTSSGTWLASREVTMTDLLTIIASGATSGGKSRQSILDAKIRGVVNVEFITGVAPTHTDERHYFDVDALPDDGIKAIPSPYFQVTEDHDCFVRTLLTSVNGEEPSTPEVRQLMRDTFTIGYCGKPFHTDAQLEFLTNYALVGTAWMYPQKNEMVLYHPQITGHPALLASRLYAPLLLVAHNHCTPLMKYTDDMGRPMGPMDYSQLCLLAASFGYTLRINDLNPSFFTVGATHEETPEKLPLYLQSLRKPEIGRYIPGSCIKGFEENIKDELTLDTAIRIAVYNYHGKQHPTPQLFQKKMIAGHFVVKVGASAKVRDFFLRETDTGRVHAKTYEVALAQDILGYASLLYGQEDTISVLKNAFIKPLTYEEEIHLPPLRHSQNEPTAPVIPPVEESGEEEIKNNSPEMEEIQRLRQRIQQLEIAQADSNRTIATCDHRVLVLETIHKNRLETQKATAKTVETKRLKARQPAVPESEEDEDYHYDRDGYAHPLKQTFYDEAGINRNPKYQHDRNGYAHPSQWMPRSTPPPENDLYQWMSISAPPAENDSSDKSRPPVYKTQSRNNDCVPRAMMTTLIAQHWVGNGVNFEDWFISVGSFLTAHHLENFIGVPLGESQQKHLATELGFGLAWILPDGEIATFYPNINRLRESFLVLVMVSPGHCEPLADDKGVPRGLLTTADLKSLASKYKCVLNPEREFPTAGANIADLKQLWPICNDPNLRDCFNRWQNVFLKIRLLYRNNQIATKNSRLLENCEYEYQDRLRDIRNHNMEISQVNEELSVLGIFPNSMTTTPEVTVIEIERRQRKLIYLQRELDRLNKDKMPLATKIRNLEVDRILLLEREHALRHQAMTVIRVRKDVPPMTDQLSAISPGATYQTPGGSKLFPHGSDTADLLVDPLKLQINNTRENTSQLNGGEIVKQSTHSNPGSTAGSQASDKYATGERLTLIESKFVDLTAAISNVVSAVHVLTLQRNQPPPTRVTSLSDRPVQYPEYPPKLSAAPLVTPTQHRTLTFLPGRNTSNRQVIFGTDQRLRVSTDYAEDKSSGLNLAFAIVPTVTILGPDSPDSSIRLEQHFLGSRMEELLRRNSATPMLGKAIIQSGLFMDDEPYDPSIVILTDLNEKVKDKFLIPLQQSLPRVAAAHPEFRDLTFDYESLRDCITCNIALPVLWPTDWNITLDKPDWLCIVRIHVGLDVAKLQPQSTTRRDTKLLLALLAHTIITFLDGRGMTRQEASTSTHARKIYAALDTNYRAAESEEPIIEILVRLGLHEPSLYAGRYRPIALPNAATTITNHTTSSGDNKDMVKIRNALWYQLQAVEPARIKTWQKQQSIQFWMLQYILVYSGHGEMQAMISTMLTLGAAKVYNAIKVLMTSRVTERFPQFSENYSQHQNVILIERIIEMHTIIVDAAMTTDKATIMQEKNLHHLFIEGIRQLLLVLRAIIYSESDPDHMARLELKRLNQLQRPGNLTDPQFWSEVVKRGRNWRTLLGPGILSIVGTELRDFLPNVAALLTDRHTLELLINLANHWITGLAANYGFANIFDLIGHDMKLSTRTAIYPPDAFGRQPPPITGHMFEKADCLRKIFDIGENLRSVGKPTNGAELVWFFLDHTSHRLSEHGVGSALLGGENSQMLYADEQASRYLDQETVPLGNNDILFVSYELPNVTSDARKYLHQNCVQQQPQLTTGQQPQSKGLYKGISSPESITILDAVKEQNRNLLETVDTKLAHLGELLRTQINTIAPPEYKHAIPGNIARSEQIYANSHLNALQIQKKMQSQSDQSSLYYAPAGPVHTQSLPRLPANNISSYQGQGPTAIDPRTHQADLGRRNMGGYGRDGREQSWNQNNLQNRTRFPPSRNLQKQEPRYMDKPATIYEDLNEDAKSHLASAIGITNVDDWKREEMKLCPLCVNGSTPANHYLNRCLKLFCATERGKLFFGVDQAASRLRKAMMDNPVNRIAFETVLAITDGTMLNLDNDSVDVAQRVIDLVIDSSEPLTMYFMNGMKLSDDLAIQEFDETRQLVVQYLTSPFLIANTKQ